ncbi:hypothetical protein [Plasmodium yoelii yoelii]|uniref:Uncharacterized protein n=1 Tax=Plasmodium yoelii yoelii TaxID=73239 RepID=Q7RHC5_PLAYO|nr:hypothetical protein [Plasmodium yoelii yoelii]
MCYLYIAITKLVVLAVLVVLVVLAVLAVLANSNIFFFFFHESINL